MFVRTSQPVTCDILQRIMKRLFGSRFLRRYFILRLIAIIVCSVCALVVPELVARYDRAAMEPRAIQFTLPLSEEFARLYNVPQEPDIESVFISGLFSHWSQSNTAFRMHNEPSDRSWTISIPFPRGRTQYKFVLKLQGQSAPIWVHDPFNPRTVADGFGGYNSELVIGLGLPPETIRLVLGSAAAAIGFYSLLSLALSLLGRFRFTATQRALVIFCLILAVAGTTVTVYSIDAQRSVARQSYLEVADMIYLALESHGFDFTDLDDPEIRLRANRALDAFYRQARMRTTTGGPAGIYSSVAQVVLFTPDGKVIALGDRNEKPLNVSLRSASFYLNVTYGESLFGKALQSFLDGSADPMEAMYILSPRIHWADSPTYSGRARLLGFNAALFPLTRDLRPVGYLGLVLNPEIYGTLLQFSIVVYLAMFAILIACCLFLFLFKQTATAINPALLNEFVRRHGLTPREVEIIRELVTGRDYQAIADKNFISLKTVKTHIHNIYRKTGAGNRLELTEMIRQRQ